MSNRLLLSPARELVQDGRLVTLVILGEVSIQEVLGTKPLS